MLLPILLVQESQRLIHLLFYAFFIIISLFICLIDHVQGVIVIGILGRISIFVV